MFHFRLMLVALILWMFAFYNIERLFESYNIASFVYVLSALGAAGVAWKRSSRWAWSLGAFGLCMVLLFTLKSRWGYPILGTALPITITEVVAIGTTFLLTYRLSQYVESFEEGAFQMSEVADPRQFEQEQERMYAEVRRARDFDRPLTLAYLKGDRAGIKLAMSSLIERSQRAAAERYAKAKIAEVVEENLRDCDLIAENGDGFVLLLPEADREKADEILHRVEEAVRSKFQLNLERGVATLPAEEVTFAGLLSRATAKLPAVGRQPVDSSPKECGEAQAAAPKQDEEHASSRLPVAAAGG